MKRDQADSETDLQALKYASFCSTLTAEDVQQLYWSTERVIEFAALRPGEYLSGTLSTSIYREFHQKRRGDELTPEEVGDQFASFLDSDDPGSFDENGWAVFELDDRPRILLTAGDFGTEVTSPVLWLNQEYGLDISCVRLQAYEHDGEYLVQAQRIIPVPEAEEYMTKRREKQDQQQSSRRPSTFTLLSERGVLREGDELLFNEAVFDEDWAPEGAGERWDPDADLWRAVVTGKTGQSDNVRWCYDGEEYSFTGLSRAVLSEVAEHDDPYISDAF